jgi:hypothetical protein
VANQGAQRMTGVLPTSDAVVLVAVALSSAPPQALSRQASISAENTWDNVKFIGSSACFKDRMPDRLLAQNRIR